MRSIGIGAGVGIGGGGAGVSVGGSVWGMTAHVHEAWLSSPEG